MRFALSLETDLSKSQALTIVDLSNSLEKYFSDRNYGEDVKELLLGVITVGSQGERFLKVRKPAYIDSRVIRDGLGNPVEISKNLGWDVKPDYEMLRKLDGKDLQSVIAIAVLNSLREIRLPKKVKDFDLQAFERDIKDFFKAEELIG